MESNRVFSSFRSSELPWVKATRRVALPPVDNGNWWRSWWMTRGWDLLQRESRRGCAVWVFQLLKEHLAVGLLDCFVHFRFAHDLTHQILDGRLRVEFQQLSHAGVVVFERLRWWRWRSCQLVWSFSSAARKRVTERSLGFCVNLVVAESARVLGSGINYNWCQNTVRTQNLPGLPSRRNSRSQTPRWSTQSARL